jgi:hypothetical protein
MKVGVLMIAGVTGVVQLTAKATIPTKTAVRSFNLSPS